MTKLNNDSVVTGIAWRYDGIPTIKEYNEFFKRPDAILRVVRTDGQLEVKIPLQLIPHSALDPHHEYVLPQGIRAGDVERWETPTEVKVLRLRLECNCFIFLDEYILNKMRVA